MTSCAPLCAARVFAARKPLPFSCVLSGSVEASSSVDLAPSAARAIPMVGYPANVDRRRRTGVLPCPRFGPHPNTFGHPPRTVFQHWDRFALTWPRNGNSWPKTFRRWRPKARWNSRSVPLRDTFRHSRRRFAKKWHPTVQRYGHFVSSQDRSGTFGTRYAKQGGAFG